MKKDLYPKFSDTPILMLLFALLSSHSSFGQVDLRSLIELAEKNYPSIATRQAQAEASGIQLSLGKNTFLPSLNATYEANYATFNNITGMNFPGTTIPISGPPSPENYNDMVPGSGAGLILRWSPIMFGQRMASIKYQRSVYEQQLAYTRRQGKPPKVSLHGRPKSAALRARG